MQELTVEERISIAEGTNDVEELMELANDEDQFVRCAVAENRCIPKELMRKFATDENHNIRGAVARNYSVPDDVLELLATDEDAFVIQFLKVQLC